MTRKEYEHHLIEVGAKYVGDNPLYRRYQIGRTEVEVYLNRAVCQGKEVCLFDNMQ